MGDYVIPCVPPIKQENKVTFKGFTLTINYLPGSDIRELKNGRVVYRKPKKQDVDFISSENLSNGDILPNSKSFEEARDFIRKYVNIGI